MIYINWTSARVGSDNHRVTLADNQAINFIPATMLVRVNVSRPYITVAGMNLINNVRSSDSEIIKYDSVRSQKNSVRLTFIPDISRKSREVVHILCHLF